MIVVAYLNSLGLTVARPQGGLEHTEGKLAFQNAGQLRLMRFDISLGMKAYL